MAYTRERAIEFWFQFDAMFLPGGASEEILEAYFMTGAPDGARVRWRNSRVAGTYPQSFVEGAQPFKDFTVLLFESQWSVMAEHFPDLSELQRASEDFGQGVLFDDRRPADYKLHTMDAGNDYDSQPFIGYHRWHAFLREAAVSGADAEKALNWNRLVGLAWAIQSEVRPQQDADPPSGDPRQNLVALREKWISMPVEQVDAQFDSYPFPPSGEIA